MNARTLIKRSLRFHWRSHLGVVLGAAIGSAALIGALIVGDSVRGSLRDRALERVGNIHYAWVGGDRLFRSGLADDISGRISDAGSVGGRVDTKPLLAVTGTGTREEGSARANDIQLYGVTTNFFDATKFPQTLKEDEVWLNEALAEQLKVKAGDLVVLRVRKPTALAQDAPIAPQSAGAVALRMRVGAVLGAADLGNFSLRANQLPPKNAFLLLDTLSARLAVSARANLVVGTPTGLLLNPKWWERPLIFLRLTRWSFAEKWEAKVAPELVQRVVSDGFPGTISDLQLSVLTTNDSIELRSERVFMEDLLFRAATTPTLRDWRHYPPGDRDAAKSPDEHFSSNDQRMVAQFTNGQPILTYLVNLLSVGTNSTPYSMVTAAGAPFTPVGMRDDEIVVNAWLAEDLGVKVGGSVSLTYFLADSGAQLIERTNAFRVRAIVPMEGIYADRTLMPEFPGIAKAESTHDWDAGFPLVHTIRPKDDAYWKQHRGTPKAFVTFAAGQRMWANRFGNLTAIRWPAPDGVPTYRVEKLLGDNLLVNIKPEQVGIRFEAVRQHALQAASQSQDFGGLFIGFSFFLILAALILMGLLFAFGLQQRAAEIGTLLAVGFRAKQVRRIFLLEGAALAFIGSVVGVIGGIVYARAMLYGLTTIWRSATNTSALTFHVSPVTVIIGLLSGTVVALVTMWLVLRRQARQPARVLLSGDSEDATAGSALTKSRRIISWLLSAPIMAVGGLVLALGIIGAAVALNETSNPGYFFGAGSLALIAGLAFAAWFLARLLREHSRKQMSASSLSVRGAARRKTRSVATIALLSCGVFLIVAIGAFRLDADANAWKRSAGTGGFALIGESTLPVIKDLNTKEGRDALGLDEKVLQGVSFVPFRVREGDDASCLNLNRAQQPRLLGVEPQLLVERDAFSFAKVARGSDGSRWPWSLLKTTPAGENAHVPAIGDAASIQWALHKKIGDSLTYQDERGNSFDVQLVGGLANSILQGSLIIDEAEFTQRFPGVSGYRMFLIDCPSNALPAVSAELTRALQDYGFEVTPAAQRLAAFNAVQNTYLSTFQVLGGLGLLLGSFGLGIVVLRNVLERRGEMALLMAVGFTRARVQKLVLAEHAALLCLGLVIGIVAAVVAILPGVLSPRSHLPVQSLSLTLFGVLVFGLISTWLATRAAVRGNLLEGLRNE
jgi:putative ABC transport system permease protein